MISNLRVTTESNQEQDWLKTNFSQILHAHVAGPSAIYSRSARKCCSPNSRRWLSYRDRERWHQMGKPMPMRKPNLCLIAGYAQRIGTTRMDSHRRRVGRPVRPGKDNASCSTKTQRLYARTIQSGRSRAGEERHCGAACVLQEQTKAVVELASLKPFNVTHIPFLEQLTQSIGVVLNTIKATMRTEGLLQQSPAAHYGNCNRSKKNCSRLMKRTWRRKRGSWPIKIQEVRRTQKTGSRTGPPCAGRKKPSNSH